MTTADTFNKDHWKRFSVTNRK